MSRLQRIAIVLLLFACAPAVCAGEVFRCRGDDGSAVFQDRPCARHTQALGSTPITAAQPATRDDRAAREERRRIDAWAKASRDRLAPSLGGRARGASVAAPRRAAERSTPPAACESARRQRAQAYAQDSNRMGFDRRRALDDAVTIACGLR